MEASQFLALKASLIIFNLMPKGSQLRDDMNELSSPTPGLLVLSNRVIREFFREIIRSKHRDACIEKYRCSFSFQLVSCSS